MTLSVLLIIPSCSDGKTCPALADTGTGTHAVVGTIRKAVGLPEGQGAVEVPGQLLGESGPQIVIGVIITDPGVLSELPVGPGEMAVEVAGLGERVSSLCLASVT